MGTHHTFPLRLALYSHDTLGLGHIRRNLAVASALGSYDNRMATLLISGTELGASFERPPGADFLVLPSVAKRTDGSYHARSLPLSLETLIGLRMNTICSALEAFAPDVFIVDKVPNGFQGELIPALEMLRRRGKTRCVLGLRDVLDDPDSTCREWRHGHCTDIVSAYYDAVWVYGDPHIYDLVQEYNWEAELAGKVRYTGYLARSPQPAITPVQKGRRGWPRRVLCMLGGGQDGIPLAQAFLRANLPNGTRATLVAGPYMPFSHYQELAQLAARRPELDLFRFTPDPLALIRQADLVVSMGGYNTVCELLAHRKPALIVPRVKPRQEQWIRAQRLQALGLIDVLHPRELLPRRLSQWIASTDPGPVEIEGKIDLNGYARLPHLLLDLVSTPPVPLRPVALPAPCPVLHVTSM